MCPICQDTKWKTVVVDGIERAERCDCWRDALVGQAMAAARIPPQYRHCELSNFEDYGSNSLGEALRLAKSFATKFPVVDRGLFLLGPTGVGKTHLAVALLKAVIRGGGARGFFYRSVELLALVRDTYNKGAEETEMGLLQPIFDADVLVLDDVGTGKTSEWTQETLGLLIDKRYSERRATILTGNLTDSVDPKQPGTSIQFVLGPRTRSRLLEMCDWVSMAGFDVRETGRHPDANTIKKWRDRTKEVESGGAGIDKPRSMAKARLRQTQGQLDLNWTGGKAGTK